jgi:hypothetical protein
LSWFVAKGQPQWLIVIGLQTDGLPDHSSCANNKQISDGGTSARDELAQETSARKQQIRPWKSSPEVRHCGQPDFGALSRRTE